MNYFISFIIFLVGVTLLISCAQKEDARRTQIPEETMEQKMSDPIPGDSLIVIETRLGTIKIEVFPEAAPKHSANFKKLAREGYYNGTTFHRVIPGFVAQGGDPNSRLEDRTRHGQGGPGYTIPAEIGINHKRGYVAAARLGDQVNPERESSGSQFYICLVDIPHLDGAYSVFGRVVEGIDVVDAIAAVDTDAADNPVERVEMRNVRVVPKD